MIVGLTGSIGMGKSTVSAMFQRAGVPVFSADAAVHQLQGPGGAVVQRIEHFFPGTTSVAGVDRDKLSAAVLGKPSAITALERIIHPHVAELRRQFVQRHRARAFVVLDIPLLFEKGGWRDVDLIITVSAPTWVQQRRVLARAGMTPAKLRHIRRLQLPDHIKRRRADIVIDTARPINVTRRRVRSLVACISAHKSRYACRHA